MPKHWHRRSFFRTIISICCGALLIAASSTSWAPNNRGHKPAPDHQAVKILNEKLNLIIQTIEDSGATLNTEALGKLNSMLKSYIEISPVPDPHPDPNRRGIAPLPSPHPDPQGIDPIPSPSPSQSIEPNPSP